ncbi:hypothetical protein D3C71_544750 [compost metagenome]
MYFACEGLSSTLPPGADRISQLIERIRSTTSGEAVRFFPGAAATFVETETATCCDPAERGRSATGCAGAAGLEERATATGAGFWAAAGSVCGFDLETGFASLENACSELGALSAASAGCLAPISARKRSM